MSRLSRGRMSVIQYLWLINLEGLWWLKSVPFQPVWAAMDIGGLTHWFLEIHVPFSSHSTFYVYFHCKIVQALSFGPYLPALIQKMACCLMATSHYLNQWWPSSLTIVFVIRTQWVKSHSDSQPKCQCSVLMLFNEGWWFPLFVPDSGENNWDEKNG